jgi:hypothetical protein
MSAHLICQPIQPGSGRTTAQIAPISICSLIKALRALFPVSFFYKTMSQQVRARSLLVLGDSNVRHYLYRAGGAYSETCDCGIVRNLSEFGTSLKMVENTHYNIIIFAMLTNIVIDAGSEGTDQASRLNAIEECLSPLLENFRYP